jgi:hypothetical protein
MWAWDRATMEAKYQQHREAVHALATEAGVRVPWIIEAIADDIERERRSAAW